MKMNKIEKLIGVLGLCAILVGCFKDPGTNLLITSASVEINEATTSSGADISRSYNKLPGGPTSVKDSLRVNLVGPQRSTPISVTYAVQPTGTAIAGVHYDLISPTTISIPANSSFGYIYYNVHPQVINPNEVFKLTVKLTAADVPISVNYSLVTNSIRITCPWQRSSFVGAYKALEPGYGTYDVTMSADLTDLAGNTVINSDFWDVGAQIKYVFNSTTATVTIPLQTFTTNIGAGNESLTVASQVGVASSYDACTGKFVVPYIVKRVSSGATLDTNTHTFTKP